jgi:hypothetical protein
LSLAEQARSTEVTFTGERVRAKDKCFVITDDLGPF